MSGNMTDAKIHIYLASKRLLLYSKEQLVKEYPVAIGKPATPTPTGEYSIRTKIMYPGGVFGSRWMEFKPRYGIHGTNNPASIGTRASLGCVRMYNNDVEDLFSKVKIGTSVHIFNSTVGNPTEPEPDPSPPNDPDSNQNTHTVQSGDTLWKLSKRYGVSITELAEVNDITNPNNLNVGQVLIIP